MCLCRGNSTDAVIYTSPTVKYAGLKFYAEPQPFGDGLSMAASIVLQCRQKPGSFTKQGETMAFNQARDCRRLHYYTLLTGALLTLALNIRFVFLKYYSYFKECTDHEIQIARKRSSNMFKKGVKKRVDVTFSPRHSTESGQGILIANVQMSRRVRSSGRRRSTPQPFRTAFLFAHTADGLSANRNRHTLAQWTQAVCGASLK